MTAWRVWCCVNLVQECVKEHYEENESDFNSCPSVNFVNLMDPFKVQLQVVWTYNFGGEMSRNPDAICPGVSLER